MSELNKTGNWIYLIKDFAMEIPLEKLSIFYAKPVGKYLQGSRSTAMDFEFSQRYTALGLDREEYHSLIHKFLAKGPKSVTPKALRENIEIEIERYNYTLDDYVSVAEIVTPYGTARVFPEEYNKVSLDFGLKAVDNGSHMIRYLSNDGNVRDRMKSTNVTEKVFYLRSRGIRFKEAMKLVSGEIRTQHLLYFDPLPQYVHQFTRGYVDKALKKRKYCKEHDFEQLLYYEGKEEGQETKFTLDDYLEHLEQEWEEEILT